MNRWVFAIVIFGLVLTAGLVAFGLGYFPAEPETPVVLEVSPTAASNAEVKLAQLDVAGEARLTEIELTSLFRYRPEIWSMGILRSPDVEMYGDTLRLNGRFATDDVPDLPGLESLRMVLPDTADASLVGTVETGQPGRADFRIAAFELEGMPIPNRYLTQILDRLGQSDEDLPPGAFALPLPPDIRSARIEQGELVVVH